MNPFVIYLDYLNIQSTGFCLSNTIITMNGGVSHQTEKKW